MRRALNNGNYKTTSIRVYHPDDDDVYTDVSVYFKWHYFAGEVPSFDNPYGEPAEYDFELIKYSKTEDWITEDIVHQAMCDVEFKSLLEEDYTEY